MGAVIQVEDVWKRYDANVAVRELGLTVPAQAVYAFLGPNGAGKSTTIRMLLGLQRPDQGSITIFGSPLARDRMAVLQRIGSLVESPSLYRHLTGRENLEVHRRLLGLPKSSIDEALKTVDLLGVSDRLVRKYSSGMMQRLGLAQALLGNPELLILDEPTNGLDPAGIHEVRSLIRELPKRLGVTVFLSSHLLAEVEQVATHLAVIARGRLMFEGTQSSLQAHSGRVILVEVDDRERAHALLNGAGCITVCDGNQIRISGCRFHSAEINSMLVQAGIAVSQCVIQRPTLEDFFLELTAPTPAAKEVAAR